MCQALASQKQTHTMSASLDSQDSWEYSQQISKKYPKKSKLNGEKKTNRVAARGEEVRPREIGPLPGRDDAVTWLSMRGSAPSTELREGFLQGGRKIRGQEAAESSQ